jgi:metallo-beta-lactamase class B
MEVKPRARQHCWNGPARCGSLNSEWWEETPMSVRKSIKAMVLASAALAVGIGFGSHADAAGRAAAVLFALDTEEAHIANAKAAAGSDLSSQLRLCNPRQAGPAAPLANNSAEPIKIFDNLYFVGVPSVSAWAITTSQGIIVIDSLDNPREAETYIEGGLRKLGLDPAQIKYVVITHAHTDHFGGAQYLADKFHPTLVMSGPDWDVLARAQAPANPNPNRGPIPKRGMSVKDGERLTLGDTTIEFHVTPPHTPGAISLIIPLKDGNANHVGALWGGIGFNFQQTEANYTTYGDSVERFSRVAAERSADVPMANHSNFDDAFKKMAALKTRAPGQPNPFVLGAETQARIFTVQQECALATRARVRSSAK